MAFGFFTRQPPICLLNVAASLPRHGGVKPLLHNADRKLGATYPPYRRGITATALALATMLKEVHEDMKRNFSAYPRMAGSRASRPDANIDHRRVPILMVFLSRQGEVLKISARAEDYAPGDLVTWDLGGNMTHIGIVVNQKSEASGRYMIVHNIGQGPRMEDVLFNWKITGHYRYFGPLSEP
jgi:uncharacterized protein YijF (DUF1287 family)